MALWFILNPVAIVQAGGNSQKLLPGELVDDSTAFKAQAAGAGIWPGADTTVATYANIALMRHANRGADEAAMEAIVRAGVDASVRATTGPGPTGPTGP